MTIDQPVSDFFTAGGTLPPDAPSYVKRPTDDELYRHIMAGEFCYVLTPRQMGKSSLMIRTAQRLSSVGVKSAVVDLTQIGTVDSEDQWYKGILTQIKRRLRLSIDPVAWWERRKDIPNIQKFIEFFEETLTEVKEHVVIFMDEIDTTLKLDFRDDFFAGIRAMFNARAENPNLKRITFVLLGVASPSDLIKDRSRTPFNIGQEIPLRPFSRTDAGMLEKGLEESYPKYGRKILDRIFYWTNGHPYLTQKLCQSVVETRLKEYSDNEIDLLVKSLFTSEEASRETNLQFVRDNVLSYPERRVILSLYKKLLRGFEVLDNKNSLPQNHLKLSGLARIEDGKLVVSNKIYSDVFDHKWVQRYTDIDWRYPIIGVLSLVILGFSLVFYNDGIRLPNRAATMVNGVPIYYQDERGIQHLAELFRMKPYIFPNEYEYKAKDIFYNSFSTWEEQRVLIEVTSYDKTRPTVEDYEIVIVGLYTSLADVDNSGETTKLLEVMYSSLKEMGMQDDAIYQEIGYWLEARKKTAQNNFDEALANYTDAINLNSQNPATRFERARLYALRGENELALKDYEQVIAIVPASSTEPTELPEPTVTSISTVTLIPTSDLFIDSTLTPEEAALAISESAATVSPIGNPSVTAIGAVVTTASLTQSFSTASSGEIGTQQPSENISVIGTASSIQPKFLTLGQRVIAVKNDIYQNRDLYSDLARITSTDYPNLSKYGIVYIPTFTPSPTAIGAKPQATDTIGTPSVPLSELLSAPYTPTALYVNIESSPLTTDFLALYGAAVKAGDWDEAIVALNNIIRADPNSIYAYYYLGEAHLRKNDLSNAIQTYNDGIQKDQSFGPMYVGMARARLLSDPNANVLSLLDEAIRLDPNFGNAYLERGNVKIRDNDIPGALKDLGEANTRLPDNPLVYHNLAQAHFKTGDYERALGAAERANQLDVTNLDNYLLLGQIYAETDRNDDAIKALQTYIKYRPDNVSASVLFGRLLFDIGEYEQTIQMMDRVTALERSRSEPFLYRFLSNVELGNGEAADEDLDEALRFYPDLFEANLALVRAHILNERYGSAEQAVDKAETLAETDEQKALIYYWAGITFEKRENSKRAAEYWQLLLNLSPNVMTVEIRNEASLHLNSTRTATPTSCIPLNVPKLSGSRDGQNVRLSWSSVLGATIYEVFVSVNGGPESSLGETNGTSMNDSISNGSTNTYYVVVYNSCGNNEYSNTITIVR